MSIEGWSGVEEMAKRLQAAKAAKAKGQRRGMGLALRNVLDVSNTKVPHEDGDLERDGGVSMTDGDATVLRGAISYGRDADVKDRAIPQHERMDYRHDNGRSAKFLENAMAQTRDENAEILAAAIKREMGT